MGTDVLFTSSKCFGNASCVPDPISHCAVDGEREISHKSQTVAITGSLFGALAVIMLILLAVVGTVIFVKKGAQNFTVYILDPINLNVCMQGHFGDHTEETWCKQILLSS